MATRDGGRPIRASVGLLARGRAASSVERASAQVSNGGMGAPAPRDHFNPRVFTLFGRLMSVVSRVWFRYALRGANRVPSSACLFVGNHSGIGIADVLCMLGAAQRYFGLTRRIVGLMHVTFLAPRARSSLPRVRRGRRVTREREGGARGGPRRRRVPGGDLDSCRPFFAPREVRFGARRGYVRLALETGAPVVPIATIGSHYTYLLAPGGAWISRALGLKRLTETIASRSRSRSSAWARQSRSGLRTSSRLRGRSRSSSRACSPRRGASRARCCRRSTSGGSPGT